MAVEIRAADLGLGAALKQAVGTPASTTQTAGLEGILDKVNYGLSLINRTVDTVARARGVADKVNPTAPVEEQPRARAPTAPPMPLTPPKEQTAPTSARPVTFNEEGASHFVDLLIAKLGESKDAQNYTLGQIVQAWPLIGAQQRPGFVQFLRENHHLLFKGSAPEITKAARVGSISQPPSNGTALDAMPSNAEPPTTTSKGAEPQPGEPKK